MDSHKDLIERPWKIAACLSWAVTIFLVLSRPMSRCGSPFTPSERDLGNFQSKQMQFTGGLKYDDDGVLFRDTTRENRSYVTSGPDVEKNWNMFAGAHWIELDAEMLDPKDKDLYLDSNGKALTSFEVFHQLHCLDMLRRKIKLPQDQNDKDRYPELHLDHCIDFLRQTLECHGDLNLVRLYWSPSASRILPDFETPRTCRDFEQILAWSLDRRAGAGEIPH